MRLRRHSVAPVERARASAKICAQLLAMNLVGPIAVYLASRDEIDLGPFIEACRAQGVRLAAPRWNGAGYELAALSDASQLVRGPHAILEPPHEAPLIAASDVGTWIVPGLAFAKDGARLGYGGGWYDRLMSESTARKIGVGYRFQLLDSLPTDAHDIRLDEVAAD